MCRDVDDGPEKQGISYLTMEPLRLVERQPTYLRSDISEDVTAHRQQNHCGIHAQDQTGASGYPDRKLERIQSSQTFISCLQVPG